MKFAVSGKVIAWKGKISHMDHLFRVKIASVYTEGEK
jgi:hypothetical protein